MAIKAKDYETLTGHERFELLIEAMARNDEVECKRLEDSCPQMVYRCDDAAFRDRMRRAYSITVTVCLNMREGITRLKMAEAIRLTAGDLAVLPAKAAQVALLYGRAYGHWEAGAVEQIDLPDAKALAKEVAANEYLGEQLDELRDAVRETVNRVVLEIHAAVGRVHAAEILSMWEGFGRFSRERLGMEPLTLVRAYGLQREDLAADVRTAYPDATPDESVSLRHAEQWTRSWRRRFA
jgi:hypothetical protein